MPWGLSSPIGAANGIQLPTTTYASFFAQPTILQMSSLPSLAADLTFGAIEANVGLGADGGNITVDTTPADVDSNKGVVVVGSGNGTYAAGETVFIAVW